MPPNVLVIEHDDSYPPGLLLGANSVNLEVVRPHAGEDLPEDLDGYAGLIVLDGPMGAYESTLFPWLRQTQNLLALAIIADIPTMGIGLGHHLIAITLGGRVTMNPDGPSQGLTPVMLTEAGRDDALFAGVGERSEAVMWNQDIVDDLPQGAVPLAHSPAGTLLAARYSARCWGLQFHPEAGSEMVETWAAQQTSTSEPWVTRRDRSRTRRAVGQVRAADPELSRRWRLWSANFFHLVHSAEQACARG